MLKHTVIRRALCLRWFSAVVAICLSSAAMAALSTQPAATQPVFIPVAGPPISVPYRLTDTNHILIRVKVNGKGPYNFIMDTGAPAMFFRVPAAKKIGLQNDAKGWAQIDTLEVEGGVKLTNMRCRVETPYQIEGMNAIGASGVDLDGLLGYDILARFRLQIDLSKDRMIWTPLDFNPPPLTSGRAPPNGKRDQVDQKEANLESTGGLLKILGPLIKPRDVAPEYRGFMGIELTEHANTVSAAHVLGGSPADKAGVDGEDRIVSIDGKSIATIAEAQAAMIKERSGQAVKLILQRGKARLTLNIICTEGL